VKRALQGYLHDLSGPLLLCKCFFKCFFSFSFAGECIVWLSMYFDSQILFLLNITTGSSLAGSR
jgi:hypothetical protein